MLEWEKQNHILNKRIEESGIDSQFKLMTRSMGALSIKLRDEHAEWPQSYIDFLVKREAVRQIITKDLIWFAYWLTDKANHWRIMEVHKVAWKFFNKGPDSLPDSYKRAGFFRWNPRPITYVNNMGDTITVDVTPWLLEIPRGLSKSVIFHVFAVVQQILKDPKGKYLMVHGLVDKAVANLKQLNNVIINPYLTLVAPDIFAETNKEYIDRGGRVTMEKINIIIDDSALTGEENINSDIRRESTCTVGSPRTDLTGQHFDMEFDDDLVTAETSRSIETTAKIYDYYRNQGALANMPGIYPRRLTGTEWYDQSLYHLIRERINTFIMPGEWYEGSKPVYVTNYYTPEIIEGLKADFGNWYQAHVLMQPMPLDNKLNLVENDDFIFQYKGEAGSFTPIDHTEETLRMAGCVVTSFDPSFSRLNKQKMGASKASIATGVICNNTLFIIHEWQDDGGEFRQLYNTMKSIIDVHNSDICIVDSHATQIAITDEWKRMLAKDNPGVRFIQDKTPPMAGIKGKEEKAAAVLGELFKVNAVRVHHSCKRLINEVKRITGGYDYLDVLCQVKLNMNFELYSHMYARKKQRNVVAYKKKNYDPVRFKVAGY